ncbi:uncharacterized protein [Dysidea avara]|uniref:uncharacterized protein n=1 Tax=Dysidea avara TaxID=196820 RepID=UPI00332E1B04
MAELKGVSAAGKLDLNNIKRWNTSTKCDYFFATQYKQSFVYFGTAAGTTKAQKDGDVCAMSGCVATLVEGVDKEDSYIWSPMPSLALRLCVNDNVHGSAKLCGGYACGEEIKMFGELAKPEYSKQMFSSKGYYTSKVIPQYWRTSLTEPSQCSQWSDGTPQSSKSNLLVTQCCQQYIVSFYLYNSFIITDEHNNVSCSFSTGSVHFNRHVKCAIVDNDAFIICGGKMAKIENVDKLLATNKEVSDVIQFTVDVPHINTTPFVVQGNLFVVGGCDKDDEPFSDIYQFMADTKEWKLVGLSTVSRYGVSTVVFTDKNDHQAVFIAGGFKGESIPCSVIEKVSVV